jgi:hypothetical protein
MLPARDDVDLLDKTINNTKKETPDLLDASKETGLGVNIEEFKYLCLYAYLHVSSS